MVKGNIEHVYMSSDPWGRPERVQGIRSLGSLASLHPSFVSLGLCLFPVPPNPPHHSRRCCLGYT